MFVDKINNTITTLNTNNFSTDNLMFTNEKSALPEEEMTRINLKKKCFTKTIKCCIFMFLSIIIYLISHIFIRYDTMGTNHFLIAFFQVSLMSIYIPLSFLRKNIMDNCIKKIPKEVEQTSVEIKEKMDEEFSEIMEKKFYENYYEYATKFYLYAFILSLLYYGFISAYYWGLYYLPPLLGNTIFAITSILVQIIQMMMPKYKFNIISNFIFIFYLCGLAFLFCYIGNSKIALNQISYTGILCFGLSAFICSLFLCFFSFITRKYKYYVNVLELCGFMGFFCLLLGPFFLIILSYLTNTLQFPVGDQLFILIGKAFLCGCVSDLLIFKCISMFSVSIESVVLGSLIGILYAIQFFLEYDSIDMIMKIFFGCGEAFLLSAFALSIAKFFINRALRVKKDKRTTSFIKMRRESKDVGYF